MDVQDFKRWHWIVIGVIVGLVLAYVWSSVEPNIPRSIGAATFANNLQLEITSRKSGAKTPVISKITVYPPIEGVYIVLGEQLTETDTPGQYLAKPFSLKATTPFDPAVRQGQGDPKETILSYLAKAKASNPNISYRYAWWREPGPCYLLWTIGSVIVIGGIWPTIINLMIGAGFGRAKEEKSDYDLDRFKGEEEKAAARKQPTAEQLAQLQRVEEQYRNSVGAGTGERAGVGVAQTEEEVMKLNGGPVEAHAVEQNKEDHEYRGEFYPVDRGAKKKE